MNFIWFCCMLNSICCIAKQQKVTEKEVRIRTATCIGTAEAY